MADPKIEDIVARFASGAGADPLAGLWDIMAAMAVSKAPPPSPPPDPGGGGGGNVQCVGQAGAFPFGNVLNAGAGNVPPAGGQAPSQQQMAQSRSVISSDIAIRQAIDGRRLGLSYDQQQVVPGASTAWAQSTVISMEQASQLVAEHVTRQEGGLVFSPGGGLLANRTARKPGAEDPRLRDDGGDVVGNELEFTFEVLNSVLGQYQRALADCASNFPSWMFWVCMDGPMRDLLEEMRKAIMRLAMAVGNAPKGARIPDWVREIIERGTSETSESGPACDPGIPSWPPAFPPDSPPLGIDPGSWPPKDDLPHRVRSPMEE